MAEVKFTNNACETLTAGITDVDTILNIGASGALFPQVLSASEDWFWCTISSDPSDMAKLSEIVRCTNIIADGSGGYDVTISRGEAHDGAAAKIWGINSEFQLLVNAELLEDLRSSGGGSDVDQVVPEDFVKKVNEAPTWTPAINGSTLPLEWQEQAGRLWMYTDNGATKQWRSITEFLLEQDVDLFVSNVGHPDRQPTDYDSIEEAMTRTLAWNIPPDLTVRILVRTGTYQLVGTTYLGKHPDGGNIALQGLGATPGEVVIKAQNQYGAFDITKNDFAGISNMRIECALAPTGNGTTPVVGVIVDHGSVTALTNLEIDGPFARGIALAYSGVATLTNIDVTGGSTFGLLLWLTSEATVYDCSFFDCTFVGIEVTGGSSVLITEGATTVINNCNGGVIARTSSHFSTQTACLSIVDCVSSRLYAETNAIVITDQLAYSNNGPDSPVQGGENVATGSGGNYGAYIRMN